MLNVVVCRRGDDRFPSNHYVQDEDDDRLGSVCDGIGWVKGLLFHLHR